MRWEREAWVKLYRREQGSFALLPLYARALAGELLKFADEDGRLFVGTREPWEAVAKLCGATTGDRRLLRAHIPMLLADGYLVRDGAHLIIRNMLDAQSKPRGAKAPPGDDEPRTNPREPGTNDGRVGTNPERTGSESARTEHEPETKRAASARNDSDPLLAGARASERSEEMRGDERGEHTHAAVEDAPTDPDVPVVLAHLASMPFPVRHLASREYAERFVVAKIQAVALPDILAGITSSALKLGSHADATPDRPETIAALADHVGGFIVNQKRIGRRGGAIPIADPDGARRTLAYFGKAWEARKGRHYGAPDADLEHAVKLWDYAKKCAGEAKLRADGRDAPDAEAHVRSIVGQYLADDDRYVADRDHPIALLLSRLGRYGLPLAGARPATGPGITIRPEDVAPIVRPPQPSAEELRSMAAAVAAGTGGAPLRRPSREAP